MKGRWLCGTDERARAFSEWLHGDAPAADVDPTDPVDTVIALSGLDHTVLTTTYQHPEPTEGEHP